MRGEPINMGGSQMEVVEKRRTVPDLSDIDEAFRPLIAAMLQPDPADRPASMADIARMTRDGTLAYVEAAPNAAVARDGKTMLLEGDRSPFGRTSPDFVPYVPPAHLSQARPLAGGASQSPSRGRSTLLAGAAALVVGARRGRVFRRLSDAAGSADGWRRDAEPWPPKPRTRRWPKPPQAIKVPEMPRRPSRRRWHRQCLPPINRRPMSNKRRRLPRRQKRRRMPGVCPRRRLTCHPRPSRQVQRQFRPLTSR